MQQSESMQKRNSADCGEGYEAGADVGVEFCGTEETVRRILPNVSGKALLLSDGCPAFADAAASPRTLSLVFDGDCLPLFAMPDGISAVLAAGGEEVARAARCFAEVRGIPCVLFPSEGDLEGVFEARGAVGLGGELCTMPLKSAKVICDVKRMGQTLSDACARLFLARLSETEGRALAAFGFPVKTADGVTFPETAEGIVAENARLREREREGVYAGEGAVLARLLRESGVRNAAWLAFLQLSALYAAFFAKGKPRRYFTPDYRERARRAGTACGEVPSAEEYVLRAMRLEQIRASFARETEEIFSRREAFRRALSKWTDGELPLFGGNPSVMMTLPEHAPHGLSAVIRDFGLMDHSDDKGRIA